MLTDYVLGQSKVMYNVYVTAQGHIFILFFLFQYAVFISLLAIIQVAAGIAGGAASNSVDNAFRTGKNLKSTQLQNVQPLWLFMSGEFYSRLRGGMFPMSICGIVQPHCHRGQPTCVKSTLQAVKYRKSVKKCIKIINWNCIKSRVQNSDIGSLCLVVGSAYICLELHLEYIT